jgi:hypothetical protein
MSSGACRALVAVVLTVVATIITALPVAALESDLNEASVVEYEVLPNAGRVRVSLIFTLTTGQAARQSSRWGPIVIEGESTPRVIGEAQAIQGGTSVPGPDSPWEHIWVRADKIDGGRVKGTFRVRYNLDARTVDVSPDIPARVDGSYVYLCVPGQETDTHDVTIKGLGGNWVIQQSGTAMEPTDTGLSWRGSGNPAEAFTCIEAVNESQLNKSTVIGPADRDIELQAWKEDPSWLVVAEDNAVDALDAIYGFLEHDIPGQSPVIIREAPTRAAGGYASAHDTAGIVQLDQDGGTTNAEHQMAHAWFGKDNVQELWLREGLADWIATAMKGDACKAVTSNPQELTLSDWLVVKPTAPEDYEDQIRAQEAAACGIVTALAARMPEETFKQEVLGSLLDGETKYIGSGGPEAGTSLAFDFREWLDAVDERGLIPAADADPAYAENRTDLDFAQNLLDEFGIPSNPLELDRRSQARAMYHDFLDMAAPLGAPLAVRKDMDDWNFDRAMQRIEQSTQVYNDLIEANRLLPEAELMPIVQPQFEAAKDEAELDAVTEWAAALVEGARQVVGPLGDLSDALPPGWTMPVAVTQALAEQRFDDIMPAITPAIEAAQQISAANDFMPQAGLLDKYRALFENTTTAAKLEELAADARSDRFAAERASFALDLLQNEIGDWTIPDAVTRPLEQGQLETGLAIVEDARAVVSAAREADLALAGAEKLGLTTAGLRDETQPLFEAVTTGAEMAALRAQVEATRDDAVAVGGALEALNMLVPDWQIPAVIADPVAAGDFAAAVDLAEAAQQWVENADSASKSLPEINALERIREDFESASSLQEIADGAALAGRLAQAAVQVALAIETEAKPRDMLTNFGLWGVDVRPTLEEAKQAAIAGQIDVALGKAADVITTINNGASSGSLRLAGIIFFGVAVVGVVGLWLMLRRQAGPPWARSTKPHWVEGEDRRLLGRGKKKEPKDTKGKKGR